MRTIFLFSMFLSFSLAYSQQKSFSYDFFKDTSGYILQEVITDSSKARTINQIPIPDSAALADNLYQAIRTKFNTYATVTADYMRLNKSFDEDYRNLNIYSRVTKRNINADIYVQIPDSLFGTYEFVDTSRNIDPFKFTMSRDSIGLLVKNESDGTVYPSFFYTFVDRGDSTQPSAMIEIYFTDKIERPVIFHFYGFITDKNIPIWVSENMQYQFYINK